VTDRRQTDRNAIKNWVAIGIITCARVTLSNSNKKNNHDNSAKKLHDVA